MAEERKLQLVDLGGMGNLVEDLVAEDVFTCEERDKIIMGIAEKHGLLAMVEAKVKCWSAPHTGKHLFHEAKSQMKVIFLLPRLPKHIAGIHRDI